MGNTKIGWTDMVWNPVTGCTKVSAGCRGCYAERIFKRPYPDREFTDVQCHPERLERPLHWRKPRRIFVVSMGDLWHDDVPTEFIDKVFAVMALAPQHQFQLLSKRPERMRAYCTDQRTPFRIAKAMDYWWADRKRHGNGGLRGRIPIEWPLGNAWLGTSVEDQASADERIPLLLDTPSTLRFLSVEPLLAPVDLQISAFNGADSISSLEGISWVIIGCESGPYRRFQGSSYRAAARDIIHQCQMANVPVFHKQMSVGGKVSADLSDWPSDLQIREFPRGD